MNKVFRWIVFNEWCAYFVFFLIIMLFEWTYVLCNL